MKKIFVLFSLFLSAAFIVSCDDDKNVGRFDANPSSGWVQFTNATAVSLSFITPMDMSDPSTSLEARKIALPIRLESPIYPSDLDVFYSVTNVSGNAADFVEFSGTYSFPEISSNSISQFTRSIEMFVKPSVLAVAQDADIVFDVTITGTSKGDISAGVSDGIRPVTKRVTIKLCQVAIASSYSAVSTALLATPAAAPAWTPDFSNPVVGQTNRWQLPTCWGNNFVPFLTGNPNNVFPYPGFLQINANNTVTITGINSAQFPNRYPGGTGTFNPCTKVISYRLSQGLFANPFQVDVVMTPVAN